MLSELGDGRVNEDDIEAFNKAFPQFAYWLTTGKTIPEAGQISPEMEKVRKEKQPENRIGFNLAAKIASSWLLAWRPTRGTTRTKGLAVVVSGGGIRHKIKN